MEDDPFLYKLLSQRLNDEGVEVEVVTDGATAIARAKQSPPSLVLLDILLPIKSGFDVLKTLRLDARFKKTPVVVLSNLSQPEDIAQMQHLGILEYVVKADHSFSEVVHKVLGHLHTASSH